MKGTENMKSLQPAHWQRPKGYANGVVASGRTVFVSGMIGSDTQGNVVSGDFVKQARQALENIVEVLAEAGAKAEHIVRMNWYLVDKNEYLDAHKQLGVAYREIIGRHYPAMTAVQVASLVEEAARLEIEVTAVIPDTQ
jgi:enamine deaminase RidA (YjgF/YER057c/UK114 family)